MGVRARPAQWHSLPRNAQGELAYGEFTTRSLACNSWRSVLQQPGIDGYTGRCLLQHFVRARCTELSACRARRVQVPLEATENKTVLKERLSALTGIPVADMKIRISANQVVMIDTQSNILVGSTGVSAGAVPQRTPCILLGSSRLPASQRFLVVVLKTRKHVHRSSRTAYVWLALPVLPSSRPISPRPPLHCLFVVVVVSTDDDSCVTASPLRAATQVKPDLNKPTWITTSFGN